MDARAAESQSIVQRAVTPIVYTQRHFEASDYNITQYAKDIINKNTRQGRQLDYWDVAVAWAFKVREVYSGDAAKCEDLIEQVLHQRNPPLRDILLMELYRSIAHCPTNSGTSA